MKSIDLKYMVLPWAATGVFLFFFYSTIYFPLDKSLKQTKDYIYKRQYDLAILQSSRIIANYHNLQAGYYLRAWGYASKGDWDLAIADYDQIIGLDLNNTDAYLWQGSLYYRKGNYDHAIADYDHALLRYYYYKTIYQQRSLAYFAKKDYKNSLKDLRQAQGMGVIINPAYIKQLENVTQTN